MDEKIIEVKSLDFGFGRSQVLHNINLNVKRGCIYGFLGPNGAGKTTTIRILLGLYRASAEKVALFGRNFEKYRFDILKSVGTLVDQPSLYNHLTGFENLEITRKLINVKKSQLEHVLEIVKLSEHANQKVNEYSHGMKQRLGLALALLPDPELLILDEPTNGLDPNGIIEIRELLRTLKLEHGKTIFLSSHLLSEVERLVTHVGIIHHGKILFEGEIEDLQKRYKKSYYIETVDPAAAKSIVESHNLEVSFSENHLLEVAVTNELDISKLIKTLLDLNAEILSFYPTRKNLEQIFLDLTNASG